MGLSQLKADVSHFAMGKTILETATLDPWLQYYLRSCCVHSRLCCALPCSWPPAAAASPRWVLPGVFFTSWTVMLKDAAQMKPG